MLADKLAPLVSEDGMGRGGFICVGVTQDGEVTLLPELLLQIVQIKAFCSNA